jgi:hypothetical protein
MHTVRMLTKNRNESIEERSHLRQANPLTPETRSWIAAY